ncbi:lipoprotein [Pseudomonas putida]|nr:lipoprotein [Pseudomonas putida]
MFLRLSKALIIATAFALALVACSRIDLAYRNLDRLVPWSLDDYLSMNRDQRSLLDERLKQHLAWHCTTELPGYLDWLDRVRSMVAEGQVTDQALQQRMNEARQAIGRVAEAITPSAAELLRGMSDAQVAQMGEAFREDISERQEKYVDTPLSKQVARRAERMEKRLTPWFGELTAAQRQRVQTWAQALGDQNRQWIANRAHWQQQLMLAMNQRSDASFEPRLAQLLQRKESLWTAQYRAAFENSEQQTRSLLIDLLQQSSPAQRQYLQQRLAKVRTDFSELKCLKG